LARQPLEEFCLHRPAPVFLGGVVSRLLAQPALRVEPVFSCRSHGDSWDANRHIARLVVRPLSHPHDTWCQEAYSALWPGQRTPTNPVNLGNDLQLSKVHLREWRDSGTRVGADEALTYFLSWYKKADLESLRTMHKGSIWTTDPEHIRRR
jgi:hypothetical protein